MAPDQLQPVEHRHDEIGDHHLRVQLADEIEAVEPVVRDRDLPTSERLLACAPSCATRRVELGGPGAGMG